ncbi:putative F-box/kelch-repeat protein At4g39756 [Brassica napus]|uniref:putative F-box/kelch-repeat protein At4g39756 n=1 Tax=Brassica napus TaxID=3708 RepID=UPI0006AAB320|nr:putative F-box/kelch-repeat protein At4g39756 [Brassica napus]
MGGCKADETKNWAEVFDPITQTWESLHDPGPSLLRSSLIKTIYGREGKAYVSNTENTNYFYDPKELRWGVAKVALNVERMCDIANVLYAFDDKNYFSWYDTKREEWRMVKGLQILVRNCCDSVIDIANYGGKLLVLWEKKQPNKWYEKNIWSSVIALERRFGDEVCGIVEWATIVLTVPRSYVFLRC